MACKVRLGSSQVGLESLCSRRRLRSVSVRCFDQLVIVIKTTFGLIHSLIKWHSQLNSDRNNYLSSRQRVLLGITTKFTALRWSKPRQDQLTGSPEPCHQLTVLCIAIMQTCCLCRRRLRPLPAHKAGHKAAPEDWCNADFTAEAFVYLPSLPAVNTGFGIVSRDVKS